MPAISVFDMLKIGVGPSSSHTLGPWRAVQRWLKELENDVNLDEVTQIQIALYGSLALTGRGHCTDKAVSLALLGYDPETIPVAEIENLLADLREKKTIPLGDGHEVTFDPETDIWYQTREKLPFHANGMRCIATVGEQTYKGTYYSVGGGFVVKEGEEEADEDNVQLPYPCEVSDQLLGHCQSEGFAIADMVHANELSWRTEREVHNRLMQIWQVMKEGLYRGCHTDGTLPGGLQVTRRAKGICTKLLEGATAPDPDAWIQLIRSRNFNFRQTLKWVSCFALAVNEENASLGRVVTAPTNGAAGVIPAVLMYHVCFAEEDVSDEEIAKYLMVAGEIGTFFKKRATISAAMGGCQAEIGVSSAMAAAALTEIQGGTVAQSLMAAEIAMEHHLGLTCDPIKGLVQVPCIERNSMGAIKAINAAALALEGNPQTAKVSLDEVIQTMWDTAQDMNSKYKETSQGGLAVNISVRVPECCGLRIADCGLRIADCGLRIEVSFEIRCSLSGVFRKIVASKDAFVIKQISARMSTKCVAMRGGCFYRSVFLNKIQEELPERR